jgi:hypothetical protein
MQKEIKIKSSSNEDKIRKYLEVIYKFHKLTDKEIAILVELVLQYQEIQTKYASTKDTDLFNKLLFDVDVKKKIKEKLQIKDSVFQNYLTVFRKKGVIKDNKLVVHFIPAIEPFDLIIKFL